MVPRSPSGALKEWAHNLLTEEKRTALFGAHRGVRQALAIFCVVATMAWSLPLRPFFAWAGATPERIYLVITVVPLGMLPVWLAVTWSEIGHQIRYGDYTWLEVLFVPFVVVFVAVFHFAWIAFVGMFGLFLVVALLGHAALAHWASFLCAFSLIVAPLLYFIGLPLTVTGLREWTVRWRAEKRWNADVGPSLGIAQDGSVFQVEIVTDQQETKMTPHQTGGSLRQQNAGAGSVNLSWLPPGVAEVIRNLQETAAPSRNLHGFLAPMWSRIEAEASRRNFAKVTELLETVHQQVEAARNLRKSFGGIQRAEMEEELANMQLQVELAKAQKELASYRVQSPEDWATQVQAEKTAEKDAKVLAIQKEIALAKEVSALRKEAMEIEDEEFRKKALARIEAIWEKNVFADEDDAKK